MDSDRGLEHATTPTSRMAMKTIAGDVLQVHGGALIVRSTGRKDRHSKVFTAKGLRDRRVRLSAHTAIQFYDVQDRLGYDRPSKAVDWLIKKAKSAIDRLSELPPCNTDPSRNRIDLVAEQSESSGYNSFSLQAQLSADLIPPPLGCRNLGLSLQTLQDRGRTAVDLQIQDSSPNDHPTALYAAGFDDGFEKLYAFGSQPLPSPSFPQRVPLQSSLDSPASHYAWNDLSAASAGKRLPIHDHPSPAISRLASDGLQGRFQNDGDGRKESSRYSSYSRR